MSALLVTGGGGGMGGACAEALARLVPDAELILCDVSAAALEQATERLARVSVSATSVAADLLDVPGIGEAKLAALRDLVVVP